MYMSFETFLFIYIHLFWHLFSYKYVSLDISFHIHMSLFTHLAYPSDRTVEVAARSHGVFRHCLFDTIFSIHVYLFGDISFHIHTTLLKSLCVLTRLFWLIWRTSATISCSPETCHLREMDFLISPFSCIHTSFSYAHVFLDVSLRIDTSLCVYTRLFWHISYDVSGVPARQHRRGHSSETWHLRETSSALPCRDLHYCYAQQKKINVQSTWFTMSNNYRVDFWKCHRRKKSSALPCRDLQCWYAQKMLINPVCIICSIYYVK